MKRHFYTLALLIASVMPMQAQQVAEKLNRAPVAVKASNGVLVSWRSLTSDPEGLTFNVYRNGTKIASDISTKTNYLDTTGSAGDTYEIETSNGEKTEVKAWSSMYKTLSVTRPSAIKTYDNKGTGRYRPDDISVADLDGDGDYEMVLKWMPDNAKDNGTSGYTSPCIFSAYEMDGTPLWSKNINLGYSIRTGNHYTPFIVYDMDGDGKAELICKTGCDSRDAQGNLVSAKGDATIQAVSETANLKLSSGHIIGGEEFLTVFNGATGAAMNTIWYNPSRSGDVNVTKSTTYGGWETASGKSTNYNRGERYNAAVAYLDGTNKLPTAIMQRGYYSYCYIWAVDWDGKELKTRWIHEGLSSNTWKTVDANNNVLYSQDTDPVTSDGKSSFGQGVHSISIGDVNNDGYDDIVIGSATIGHDGKLLCSTGLGHGDAIHLADLVPSRPGLEVMMPHEESPYGHDVHDATTGELLAYSTGSSDNGRGIAGNFIPASTNSVFWSSAFSGNYDCSTGKTYTAKKGDTNFRIYWTGDPYDQTFDGHYDSKEASTTYTQAFPTIGSFNTAGNKYTTFQSFAEYGSPTTCNTTKATPCLQADILGDWREEIIMYKYETDWSAANCDLMIFSTPEETNYKVPCLMQDHMYRMGIVWQNSSYNQPPHLGYNLANYLGIDGSKYTMQTQNHAPEIITDPNADLTETVKAPSEDKGTITGTCYTAGANQELTASTSGNSIKMRTGNNGNTITISVNSGYVVTGIKITAYSNNSSTTANRSITLTDITVDGTTPVLTKAVIFPGGTAGQTPTTAEASGFEATKNIVLSFDNSNITTSDVDSNGKNKQIYATIVLTYKKADTSGIEETETFAVNAGDIYTISGQKTNSANRPGIYVKNGKKFIVK